MLQVFIEAEVGSCNRHLYNEQTLEYKGTRRVARPYPYPYGFIMGTSGADGGNVDCYLITNERLTSGTIVECEPLALLEQHEDGEVDHKILAAIPGQDVEVGQELLQELRDFIYAVFAEFPEARVRVGPLLPREAALHHIQSCRDVS